MIRPCLVIPMYEHGHAIGPLLGELAPLGLPCLVVDDGSSEESRQLLDRAAAAHGGVEVLRHPENRGKGAAVTRGLYRAREMGYTHALQIDADRQHAVEDIPAFLEAAGADPEALILGTPIFAPGAPRSRLYGRRLSTFWVRVETLSGIIEDPLCGFRCYPVEAAVRILDRQVLGAWMDFDPEIAVRMYWEGVNIRNIPTRVRYPEDGVSHFDLLRDNARIAWMHTRLVIGMLPRIPRLLSRRGTGR